MSAEATINRRSTKAFIDADPLSVVLVPQTNTRQPGGGRKWTAEDGREPQTMRLIPQNQSATAVQGPDGTTITATYVLLGEWDCEMALWDKFTAHGMDCQVVTPPRRVPFTNAYETKAEVAVL